MLHPLFQCKCLWDPIIIWNIIFILLSCILWSSASASWTETDLVCLSSASICCILWFSASASWTTFAFCHCMCGRFVASSDLAQVPLELDCKRICFFTELMLHPLFQRKCLSNCNRKSKHGIDTSVASSVSAQVPLRLFQTSLSLLSVLRCILCFSASASETLFTMIDSL